MELEKIQESGERFDAGDEQEEGLVTPKSPV